jgi:hypothetical protein
MSPPTLAITKVNERDGHKRPSFHYLGLTILGVTNMTDTATVETTATTSTKPPYIAYSVRERGEGKRARFTEIGVAFPHKDGKGFDILYDAIPLSGRITLRVNEPKK